MISDAEELALNGCSAPGFHHIWVVPDDREIDKRIRQLYPDHSYTAIAEKLHVSRTHVCGRIKHMIRDGKIKGKYASWRATNKRPWRRKA